RSCRTPPAYLPLSSPPSRFLTKTPPYQARRFPAKSPLLQMAYLSKRPHWHKATCRSSLRQLSRGPSNRTRRAKPSSSRVAHIQHHTVSPILRALVLRERD